VHQINLAEFLSTGTLVRLSSEVEGTQIHEAYQNTVLSTIFTLNWSSVRFKELPVLLGLKQHADGQPLAGHVTSNSDCCNINKYNTHRKRF
jgi:hypothetical protein